MVIRVGVIGTGFGGAVHIPGLQRLEGEVDIVALTSGRLDRAREVAAKFGIPRAFDDYRAMLAETTLDLLTIVTPPYLHHDMVLAAAERGVHVLCEKPLAMNVEEAQSMLAAVERAGVVHAVNHILRLQPGYAAIKRLVEEGYLGEPRQLRGSWRNDSRADPLESPFEWWYEEEKGGGVLGALGSHDIDSFQWWFGRITEVSAALDVTVPFRADPLGGPWQAATAADTASILLRFEGGGQGSISLSAAAGVPGRRTEVFGSQGTLVFEDGRLYGARQGEKQLTPLAVPEPAFTSDGDSTPLLGHFAEMASRVVRRIRGEPGEPFPTFHDGLRTQAVIDAVRRAAKTRRWETVPSVSAYSTSGGPC